MAERIGDPPTRRSRQGTSPWLCVCVCDFVLLPNLGESLRSRGFLTSQEGTNQRFRIAGVPPHPILPQTTWVGWIPLAIPVPSSSSHTTTTLATKGLCPGGSVVLVSPMFVRAHLWSMTGIESKDEGVTVPALNQLNHKSRVTCIRR